MDYRIGKRGGLYRIRNGKKVYLKMTKGKNNSFGLVIYPSVKISNPDRKKSYEKLRDILRKIEKKTGETLFLDSSNLVRSIVKASTMMQFWETMIAHKKDILPVDVRRDITAVLIPFLIQTDDNIKTMTKYNINELNYITRVLTKHYKRIFITYMKT